MDIRDYKSSDAKEITDLFHNTVHAISTTIYSKEALEAWSPSPPDYKMWAQRLSIKLPYVAIKDEVIIGYVELEKDGHIDCLYVHKDYQGQGVASELFNYLMKKAMEQNMRCLYVEASLLALPLFRKKGFEVIKLNEIERCGVKLVNYSMTLKL
jgi:putative acetyltransferase